MNPAPEASPAPPAAPAPPAPSAPPPAAPAAAGPASGHCPVCAGALAEGAVVACASCDTRHHLDCIEYGGGCAIFGCGSRGYRDDRSQFAITRRPPPSAEPVPKDALAITGAVLAGASGELHTIVSPVIRVEARTVVRSRRIALWMMIGVAGAAVAGAYALTPGLLPTLAYLAKLAAEVWRIMALLVVFAGLGVAAALWFAIAGGLPMLYEALVMMVHLSDHSDVILDRPNRRLVRRRVALGFLIDKHHVPLDRVRALALTTPGPGMPVKLEALAVDGTAWTLADDVQSCMVGYHWSDLARIGRRLARDAELEFEWRLPWKGDQPALPPAKMP